jgi:glycosyltransferase involved in cell wall biosynthesis
LPTRNLNAYAESYEFGKLWYKRYGTEKYDIILNNSGFPCDHWLRKYRINMDVPFVDRVRSSGKEIFIQKYMLPDAMVFLTESHMSKVYFGNKKGVFVIPNGIDVSLYRKRKTKTYDYETPRILSIGAMASVKRHELVIDTVSMMDIGTLIIAGNIADKKYSEKIVSYGKKVLDDRFVFLGELPHEEIINLYKFGDVFTLASFKEGFSNCMLEALASGLSVVTTDTPDRREFLGDSGFLCNPHDRTEYLKQLFAGIEKRSPKKSIEQAKKYDWKNIISKYSSCFNNTISRYTYD